MAFNFEWMRRWRMRRVMDWKYEVLETLFREVIPETTPYLYQTAPSLLNPPSLDVRDPLTLDIFLHDSPLLAIDVLGPHYRPNYREACPYISRPDWERLQVRLAEKRQILGRYLCPYFTITDDEAIDALSIADRIHTQTSIRFR